jgi:TRAP-type mannitol/chloroaromatic compound transport system permease large subunit
MFANNAWGVMENYVLVAIPLFILMAQLLDRSKVSDKLFEALYVVLGSIKGGLGLAVVVVCTVFAATTGIIGASVVAMGLLATPALLRKNYQKEMTSGIICAAGTLGILIPPSIMMVVYGGLDRAQGDHRRQPLCRGDFPGPAAGGPLFCLHFDPLQHQSATGPPDFQGRGRHNTRPPRSGA